MKAVPGATQGTSRGGPAVVALGGGHGLAASLASLRRLTDDLTAIVTVADNGGSSGRIRQQYDVLPPGDLRMALAALCGDDEWGQTWAAVLQHRFAGDGDLRGARRLDDHQPQEPRDDARRQIQPPEDTRLHSNKMPGPEKRAQRDE